MENDFNVIDLWLLKMGAGYKEVERQLLKVDGNRHIASNSHNEIYRNETKVISEKRLWDNTWVEGDTQFEYDCDGSQRQAWEERKPQYIKDGFNYLIICQREWIAEEYDKFIEKSGKDILPFLNLSLDNANIIYIDDDKFEYNLPK